MFATVSDVRVMVQAASVTRGKLGLVAFRSHEIRELHTNSQMAALASRASDIWEPGSPVFVRVLFASQRCSARFYRVVASIGPASRA